MWLTIYQSTWCCNWPKKTGNFSNNTFFDILINGTIFGEKKKGIENKMCILIFSTPLV
jgi:hypothetical protein